jgi:signal transduction histidine kinase/ActR/RegA family two-component response regulator
MDIEMGFEQKQGIRAAQIQLLYEQLPPAIFASVVNAAILVAVLWKEVSHTLLLVWLVVILLVAWGRYVLRRSYVRNVSTNAKSPGWGKHYLFGVVANAALWGFAGLFFFTPNNYVYQVFLAFVLLGMVSGSVSTLSSLRDAHLLFLVPALLPYAVRLLSVKDGLHLAMAGMLTVYVAMMSIIGHRLHAAVTESLRLRFYNLDLLQDLTLAKDRQEAANQELAAQVAQKLSAQDELQKAYAELERRVEERTAELKKSEEALRDADRRKDEFLAMLGHELRNPLAPIRNALQLMNKSGVSDSALKWTREVIDRQIDRLTRLVDDLLDVSRIVYGKISLQQTTLEIATVVNHAIEGSLPFIEARRQKLAVHVPEERLWVKGDLVRLEQVISNVIENAAKYSDSGEQITLAVEASQQSITVRVRDHGMGIAADMLPYVFDLFVQGNRSLARTHGGLGIGLTVVRRLVEMHGGRVEAHSEGPGHGAEFLVHLPRQPAPAQTEMRAPRMDQVPGSAEEWRVLVVDDNQDAVETLALLMKFEGYTVSTACDGVTALAEAARFKPHVVLLDIGMPGMDGYQVAQQLRSRESSSIIVIAITGYGQPDDRGRAKAAGFTDHLTKPVHPELLSAALKTHLQRRQ